MSSQYLVIISANSNLLFKINSVTMGGVFWFRWVGVLVGIQNCGYIMVALFCKPEIGICISLIVSQLVGAIVGVSSKVCFVQHA